MLPRKILYYSHLAFSSLHRSLTSGATCKGLRRFVARDCSSWAGHRSFRNSQEAGQHHPVFAIKATLTEESPIQKLKSLFRKLVAATVGITIPTTKRRLLPVATEGITIPIHTKFTPASAETSTVGTTVPVVQPTTIRRDKVFNQDHPIVVAATSSQENPAAPGDELIATRLLVE